jgi:hypothetical protein
MGNPVFARITLQQQEYYRNMGIEITQFTAEEKEQIDDYLEDHPSGTGLGSVIHNINSARTTAGNPTYQIREVNGAMVIDDPALDQLRAEQRKANIERIQAEIDRLRRADSRVAPARPTEPEIDTAPIVETDPAPQPEIFIPDNGNFNPPILQEAPIIGADSVLSDEEAAQRRAAERLAEVERLEREAEEAAARAEAARLEHQQLVAGQARRGPTAEEIQAYQREQAMIEAGQAKRGPTAEEIQAYQREQAMIEAGQARRGPTAEEIQAYQREQAMIEAGQARRGPTAEEIQAYQREQAMIEAGQARRGPTAEEIQAYQREQAMIEAGQARRGPTADEIQAYQREQDRLRRASELADAERAAGAGLEDIPAPSEEEGRSALRQAEIARLESEAVEAAARAEAARLEHDQIEAGLARRGPTADEIQAYQREQAELAAVNQTETTTPRDPRESLIEVREERISEAEAEIARLEELSTNPPNEEAGRAFETQIERLRNQVEEERNQNEQDRLSILSDQERLAGQGLPRGEVSERQFYGAGRFWPTQEEADRANRIEEREGHITDLRSQLATAPDHLRGPFEERIAELEELNRADLAGEYNPEAPVACTEDAMVCPDGTTVGRTGPNCEFVCPEEETTVVLPEGGENIGTAEILERQEECQRIRDCRASWCGEENYNRCINGTSIDDIMAEGIGEVLDTTQPDIPAQDPVEEETNRRPLELSDVLIEPYGDFRVLPNRRGAAEETIRTSGNNTRVRIVGERGSMYVIQLYQNGERQPGEYLIDKSWAHRTFNMQAVLDMIEMGEMVEEIGDAPGDRDCLPQNVDPVDTDEIRDEVGYQEVVEPSTEEFKEGCDILAGDVSTANRDQLMTCFNNIKRAIAPRDVRCGGEIDRDKLFYNMYHNLRPEEQHFAGMMFTSVGEAGIITQNGATSAPKYQEAMFVMLTMDNRLRNMRGNHGNNMNALDVSLMHRQYSMYNSSIFNRSYRPLFEPENNTYRTQVNHSLDAYIHFMDDRDKLEPQEVLSKIGNYYNPHGMRRVRNQAERNRVQRLKAEGKIPADHPDDRVAPNWDFDSMTLREDLSYDGTQVRTARPFKHSFYEMNNGNIFYGNDRYAPPSWRNMEGAPTCD